MIAANIAMKPDGQMRESYFIGENLIYYLNEQHNCARLD
jgi:hypothetical protein